MRKVTSKIILTLIILLAMLSMCLVGVLDLSQAFVKDNSMGELNSSSNKIPLTAQYPEITGTFVAIDSIGVIEKPTVMEGEFYLITDAKHFVYAMRDSSFTKYKLMKHFVVNTTTWITTNSSFGGILDGNGQTVLMNIVADTPYLINSQNAGILVNNVEPNAVIKNLNYFVTPQTQVGADYSRSSQGNDFNSFTTFGGMVGQNRGLIEDCRIVLNGTYYAKNMGDVEVGKKYRKVGLGGIAGRNYGTIKNNFLEINADMQGVSTGASLAGGVRTSVIGGLIGVGSGGTVIDNYVAMGANNTFHSNLSVSMGRVFNYNGAFAGESGGSTIARNKFVVNDAEKYHDVYGHVANEKTGNNGQIVKLDNSGDLTVSDVSFRTISNTEFEITALSSGFSGFSVNGGSATDKNTKTRRFTHNVNETISVNFYDGIANNTTVSVVSAYDWNRVVKAIGKGYKFDIALNSDIDLGSTYLSLGGYNNVAFNGKLTGIKNSSTESTEENRYTIINGSKTFLGFTTERIGGYSAVIKKLGANAIIENLNVDLALDQTIVNSAYNSAFIEYSEGARISNINFNSRGNLTTQTSSVESRHGLFAGYINGGTVSNVKMVLGGSISATGSGQSVYVGAGVGYAENATFNNVNIESATAIKSIGAGYITGGFIGEVRSVSINNSVIRISNKITGALSGGTFFAVGGAYGAMNGNFTLNNTENYITSLLSITLESSNGTVGGMLGLIRNGSLSISNALISSMSTAYNASETAKGSVVGNTTGKSVTINNVWGVFANDAGIWKMNNNGAEDVFASKGGNTIGVFNSNHGNVLTKIDKTQANWTFEFEANELNSPFYDGNARDNLNETEKTGWFKNVKDAQHLIATDGVKKEKIGSKTVYKLSADVNAKGVNYTALFMYRVITDGGEFNRFAQVYNSGVNFPWVQPTLDVVDNKLNFNAGITPLGSETHPFQGTFDGNGIKVTHSGHTSGGNVSGMFGVIGSNGTVKNFTFENTGTFSGTSFVGSIAGVNMGVIDNVQVRTAGLFSITSGTNNASHFIGLFAGKSTGKITNSSLETTAGVKAQVTLSGTGARAYLSGFIGELSGSSNNLENISVNLHNQIGIFEVNKTGGSSNLSYVAGLIGYANGATSTANNIGVSIAYGALNKPGTNNFTDANTSAIYNASIVDINLTNTWYAIDKGEIRFTAKAGGGESGANKIVVVTDADLVRENTRGFVSVKAINNSIAFATSTNERTAVAGWFKEENFLNVLPGSNGVYFNPQSGLSGNVGYVSIISTRIKTQENLQKLSDYVNAGNSFENVVFSIEGINDEHLFDDETLKCLKITGTYTPIGTATNPFRGRLNGNDNPIVIDRNARFVSKEGKSVDNAGIFGYVSANDTSQASIHNLVVYNETKINANVAGGVLVGHNEGGNIGSYINASGKRISGKVDIYLRPNSGVLTDSNAGYTGAVVGKNSDFNNNKGDVRHINVYTNENSANKAVLSGGYVGGIIGLNRANLEKSMVVLDKNISFISANAGGIVGYNDAEGRIADVLLNTKLAFPTLKYDLAYNASNDLTNNWLYFENSAHIKNENINVASKFNIMSYYGNSGSYMSADIDAAGNIIFTIKEEEVPFYGWVADMTTGEKLDGVSSNFAPKGKVGLNAGAVFINFTITSFNDLQSVGNNPNLPGLEYRINKSFEINSEFSLGSVRNPFLGNFIQDKNTTITYIKGSSSKFAPLFVALGDGNANYGVVDGLNIVVYGDFENEGNMGIVAGENNGTIKNFGINVYGSISGNYAGAIVGKNLSNGKIHNGNVNFGRAVVGGANSDGGISGFTVGGIAGQNDGAIFQVKLNTLSSNVYSDKSDIENAKIGGFVGINNGSIYSNTLNLNHQVSSYDKVSYGGIFYENNGSIESIIIDENIQTHKVYDVGAIGINNGLSGVVSGLTVTIKGNFSATNNLTNGININNGIFKNSIIQTSNKLSGAVNSANIAIENNGTVEQIKFEANAKAKIYSQNVAGVILKNTGNISKSEFVIDGEIGSLDNSYNVSGFVGTMTSGSIENNIITIKAKLASNDKIAVGFLKGEGGSVTNTWIARNNSINAKLISEGNQLGLNELNIIGDALYNMNFDSNYNITITVPSSINAYYEWYENINNREVSRIFVSAEENENVRTHILKPSRSIENHNRYLSFYDLDIDGERNNTPFNGGLLQEYKEFVEYFNSVTGGDYFYGIEFKLKSNLIIDANSDIGAVGNDTINFNAIFNAEGNSVTIRDNMTGDNAGLFGIVGKFGLIKNLNLVIEAQIGYVSTNYAGGLAGQFDGTADSVVVSFKNSKVESEKGKLESDADNRKGAFAGEIGENAKLNNVWVSMQNANYPVASNAVKDDNTGKFNNFGINVLNILGVINPEIKFVVQDGQYLIKFIAQKDGLVKDGWYEDFENGRVVDEDSGIINGVNGGDDLDLLTTLLIVNANLKNADFVLTYLETEIYDLEDLERMRDNIEGFNCSNVFFNLRDNLYIGDGDSNLVEFKAIGSSDSKFESRFNGNGFTISILEDVVITGEYAGLFGYIGSNGEINGLKVEVKTVNIGNDKTVAIGGMAGFSEGYINNSIVEMNHKPLLAEKDNVSFGGIAGIAYKESNKTWLVSNYFNETNVKDEIPTVGETKYGSKSGFNALYVKNAKNENGRIVSKYNNETIEFNSSGNNFYGYVKKVDVLTNDGVLENATLTKENTLKTEEFKLASNTHIYSVFMDTEIDNDTDFQNFIYEIKNGINLTGVIFTLNANILLPDVYSSIGTQDNNFKGIFDGNGNKIIVPETMTFSDSLIGVFGYTEINSKIKNLYIENRGAVATNSVAGLIAGYNKGVIDTVIVDNLSSDNLIKVVGENVGNINNTWLMVDNSAKINPNMYKNYTVNLMVASNGKITASLSHNDKFIPETSASNKIFDIDFIADTTINWYNDINIGSVANVSDRFTAKNNVSNIIFASYINLLIANESDWNRLSDITASNDYILNNLVFSLSSNIELNNAKMIGTLSKGFIATLNGNGYSININGNIVNDDISGLFGNIAKEGKINNAKFVLNAEIKVNASNADSLVAIIARNRGEINNVVVIVSENARITTQGENAKSDILVADSTLGAVNNSWVYMETKNILSTKASNYGVNTIIAVGSGNNAIEIVNGNIKFKTNGLFYTSYIDNEELGGLQYEDGYLVFNPDFGARGQNYQIVNTKLEIESLADFIQIGYDVSAGFNLSREKFVLSGNIVINENLFKSIGNSSNSFAGEIDGNNNSLVFNGNNVPLFYSLDTSATIKNVNVLVNGNTEFSNLNDTKVGVLAYINKGAIRDLNFTVAEVATIKGNNVAGLIGTNEGVIKGFNAEINGKIIGVDNAGGLVVDNKGQISETSSENSKLTINGKISAVSNTKAKAGGLASTISSGSVSGIDYVLNGRIYAKGGSLAQAGGFASYNNGEINKINMIVNLVEDGANITAEAVADAEGSVLVTHNNQPSGITNSGVNLKDIETNTAKYVSAKKAMLDGKGQKYENVWFVMHLNNNVKVESPYQVNNHSNILFVTGLGNVDIDIDFDGSITLLAGSKDEGYAINGWYDVINRKLIQAGASSSEPGEELYNVRYEIKFLKTIINTLQDLKDLATMVNNNQFANASDDSYAQALQNAIYTLGQNITINERFSPIGTATTPFMGKFDGSNFKIIISNEDSILAESGGTLTNVGIFGVIGVNGIVANLNVDVAQNARLGDRNSVNVGAIAGINRGIIGKGDLTINGLALAAGNDLVYANISGYFTGKNVGGLVGVNYGIINNYNVINTANNASELFGGFVGDNRTNAEIKNIDLAVNFASVDGINNKTVLGGGFAGRNSGKIYNAYVDINTNSNLEFGFAGSQEGELEFVLIKDINSKTTYGVAKNSSVSKNYNVWYLTSNLNKPATLNGNNGVNIIKLELDKVTAERNYVNNEIASYSFSIAQELGKFIVWNNLNEDQYQDVADFDVLTTNGNESDSKYEVYSTDIITNTLEYRSFAKASEKTTKEFWIKPIIVNKNISLTIVDMPFVLNAELNVNGYEIITYNNLISENNAKISNAIVKFVGSSADVKLIETNNGEINNIMAIAPNNKDLSSFNIGELAINSHYVVYGRSLAIDLYLTKNIIIGDGELNVTSTATTEGETAFEYNVTPVDNDIMVYVGNKIISVGYIEYYFVSLNITSETDFEIFEDYVLNDINFEGKSFTISNDIEIVKDITIGDNEKSFKGNIDGKGFAINMLNVNSSGLFAGFNGELSNLLINGVDENLFIDNMFGKITNVVVVGGKLINTHFNGNVYNNAWVVLSEDDKDKELNLIEEINYMFANSNEISVNVVSNTIEFIDIIKNGKFFSDELAEKVYEGKFIAVNRMGARVYLMTVSESISNLKDWNNIAIFIESGITFENKTFEILEDLIITSEFRVIGEKNIFKGNILGNNHKLTFESNNQQLFGFVSGDISGLIINLAQGQVTLIENMSGCLSNIVVYGASSDNFVDVYSQGAGTYENVWVVTNDSNLNTPNANILKLTNGSVLENNELIFENGKYVANITLDNDKLLLVEKDNKVITDCYETIILDTKTVLTRYTHEVKNVDEVSALMHAMKNNKLANNATIDLYSDVRVFTESTLVNINLDFKGNKIYANDNFINLIDLSGSIKNAVIVLGTNANFTADVVKGNGILENVLVDSKNNGKSINLASSSVTQNNTWSVGSTSTENYILIDKNGTVNYAYNADNNQFEITTLANNEFVSIGLGEDYIDSMILDGVSGQYTAKFITNYITSLASYNELVNIINTVITSGGVAKFESLDININSDFTINNEITKLENFNGKIKGNYYSINITNTLESAEGESLFAVSFNGSVENLIILANLGEYSGKLFNEATINNVFVITNNENIMPADTSVLVIDNNNAGGNGYSYTVENAMFKISPKYNAQTSWVKGYYYIGESEPFSTEQTILLPNDSIVKIKMVFAEMPEILVTVYLDGHGLTEYSFVKIDGQGRYLQGNEYTITLEMANTVDMNKGILFNGLYLSGGGQVTDSLIYTNTAEASTSYEARFSTLQITSTDRLITTFSPERESWEINFKNVLGSAVNDYLLVVNSIDCADGIFNAEINAGEYGVSIAIKNNDNVIGYVKSKYTVNRMKLTKNQLEITFADKKFDASDAAVAVYNNKMQNVELILDDLVFKYDSINASQRKKVNLVSDVKIINIKQNINNEMFANFYIDLEEIGFYDIEAKIIKYDVQIISDEFDAITYSPSIKTNNIKMLSGKDGYTLSDEDRDFLNSYMESLGKTYAAAFSGNLIIGYADGIVVNAETYDVVRGSLSFVDNADENFNMMFIEFDLAKPKFVVNTLNANISLNLASQSSSLFVYYNRLPTSNPNALFSYVGSSSEDIEKLKGVNLKLDYIYNSFLSRTVNSNNTVVYLVTGSVGQHLLNANIIDDENSKNYNITITPSDIEISKRAITMTGTLRSNKSGYGEDLVDIKFSTINVNSEYISSKAVKEEGRNVGKYNIILELYDASTGVDISENFSITYKDAIYEIIPAVLTVKINDTYYMNYGDSIPEFSYEEVKFPTGVTLTGKPMFNVGTSSAENPIVNTAGYKLTAGTLVFANEEDKHNYSLKFETNGKMFVRKTNVYVKMQDMTMTYGDAIPQLIYQVVSIENNKIFDNNELSSTVFNIKQAELTKKIADYKNNIAGEKSGINYLEAGVFTIGGTFKSSNLEVKVVTNTLKVDKKKINAIIGDKSKEYNKKIKPNTSDISIELLNNLVGVDINENGENIIENLGITFTWKEDVGKQVITIDSVTNKNYEIIAQNGTMTIRKGKVTVTVSALSKKQGELDPVLTYSVRGTLGTDKFTGNLVREDGEKVGEYKITAGTLALDESKYDVEFDLEDAIFTIEKSGNSSNIVPIAVGAGGGSVGLICLVIGAVAISKKKKGF